MLVISFFSVSKHIQPIYVKNFALKKIILSRKDSRFQILCRTVNGYKFLRGHLRS